MAGKAKGVPRDTTVTLRLPQELHDRLKEAAAGRSVSEEIRRRLEASFTDMSNDAKTERLLSAVSSTARMLRDTYEPWHEDRYAFEVLKVATIVVLEHFRPAGEPVPRPDPKKHLLPDLLGPDHSPDVIGRTLALLYLTGDAP